MAGCSVELVTQFYLVNVFFMSTNVKLCTIIEIYCNYVSLRSVLARRQRMDLLIFESSCHLFSIDGEGCTLSLLLLNAKQEAVNTNFYSLCCDPTGNRTWFYCFSCRRSICSTTDRYVTGRKCSFMTRNYYWFVNGQLNRCLFQSSKDQVLACEFNPYIDGAIVTCGKSHINFWALESGQLTRKQGLFEVSSF